MDKKKTYSLAFLTLGLMLASVSFVVAQNNIPIVGDLLGGGLDLVTIATVGGLILLVMGFMGAGKTKKTGRTMLWTGAILLGVVFLFPTVLGGSAGANPFGDLFGGLFGGSGTGAAAPAVGGVATICGVEDTTVTVSAQDKYTSASTGGTHRYRINGAPALTVADAGTFTASPGDSIEILWQNGTSQTYVGDVSNEVLACAGTVTLTKELVANGTVTIEVFNEEGNLIAVGENETLAAGDVVTLEAKLKGTYQTGFPHGGIVIVEYNNTAADDVIVDFGGVEVPVPQVETSSLTAVGYAQKAYSVPPLLSNQIIAGSVTIDVDDTNNPGTYGNVTLAFRPNDYSTNEDTGGTIEGPAVEDEDDVATFNHRNTFVISVD